jgi:hypothetical protein
VANRFNYLDREAVNVLRAISSNLRPVLVLGAGGVVLSLAVGCSSETPTAVSPHSTDALRKEADAQKQMRAREARNR